MEQQVAPETSLTVGYLGSHSYHQILSEDLNEPAPTWLPDGSAVLSPRIGRTPTPTWQTRRRGFRTGVGMYNALTVDLKRSFSRGLQFRANYTWSKNLDDGTAWNTSVSVNTPAFVMFPLRPKLDWGPAATDVRHIFGFNGTYELPFGPKRHFAKSPRGR